MLSSCGHSVEARREGCKIKVGIVFDIGGKNDRSFNASAWEGVKRAEKDLPICLYDVEPGNPTSIEPAMRAFAEKNFDLIIGIGFAQGPIMQKVATDYPNIKFAIVDGVIFEADGKTPMKNVASLVFREHEGSYLVGMIAAKKSKTGVLGFVGGMDIPLIHKFETGYAEGAQVGQSKHQDHRQLRRRNRRSLEQSRQRQGTRPRPDRQGCRRHFHRGRELGPRGI